MDFESIASANSATPAAFSQIKKIRRDILSIHEKALVAKDVLETLRKPGGTKN